MVNIIGKTLSCAEKSEFQKQARQPLDLESGIFPKLTLGPMDIVYCSNRSRASEIFGVLARPPVEMQAAYKMRGPWGALVATESTYWGYAPTTLGGELFCVVGDPLVSDVAVRERLGASRTIGIAGKWKLDAKSVEPEHPAALIRAQAPTTVQVITDAWGAVPLFYGLFGGDLYIATSPDLIALCVPTELDDLSVREFLATTQLSFPNTLFKDIWQIAPASSTTLTPDGIVSSSRYWTPPLPIEGESVPAWAERLRESVTKTFGRIRAELGGKGAATLSAGLDTRYLVAMATRGNLLDVEAITISPIRNQESGWRSAQHICLA
ncbi:hypothetical protein AUC71_04300 [Methyloceanibacter marginalis]|uniref:Asparagine synthetase domain-containing protein n=1 Tax=Methyloceanibacter marginalis TaxID=1774971 RepID=A0A1E3VTE6_9HYPH|nr:hypothetical protein [Methyloceanibacter marginalis]ODR96794.1 hypothetical protein AUC71_04300 [Methyloceanibacter marginalis]